MQKEQPSETDPERRLRYGQALLESVPSLVSVDRVMAAIFFASLHAAQPGLQDRNAEYQVETYERCIRIVKTAVERLKA